MAVGIIAASLKRLEESKRSGRSDARPNGDARRISESARGSLSRIVTVGYLVGASFARAGFDMKFIAESGEQ